MMADSKREYRNRNELRPEERSEDEQAAQDWHDQEHSGVSHKCWCCCYMCHHHNPHYRAAKVSALNDVAERIRCALATARAPQRNKWGDETNLLGVERASTR